MARFNLENLPKCGAKTRSGKPCQRYGNNTNGRCKLHGGRSTGAKTKEGKLALRTNALLNVFAWHCDKTIYLQIKNSDLEGALTAYLTLIELQDLDSRELKDLVFNVVSQYRVELEMCKYLIAERDGAFALLLIQSALDHYYKDDAYQHLLFHIHAPIYPTPFFQRLIGSNAEFDHQMKLMINADRKKGPFYTGSTRLTPGMRAFNKQIKALKNYAKKP
ncbi:HGGxSTG domain-containing protein [Shewanella sp. 125m-1]